MNNEIWILPSRPDPEASAIRSLLTDVGATVAESWDDPAVQAIRWHGGAIRAIEREDWPYWAAGPECDCAAIVWRIDHHAHGDPPAKFLAASSLGQVIAALARLGRLPQSWATLDDGDSHHDGVRWTGPQSGEIDDAHGVWGVWDPAGVCRGIPHDLVMTAAAEHEGIDQ